MDRSSASNAHDADPQGAPAATPPQVRLGVLADYVGFHLRLAQNAAFRAYKMRTGDPEVRPGWFSMLALIDANPGITPVVLSRASGRDKSTLTPILRDLTQRRLIARTPVAGDRRSYALTLTEAGAEKLALLAKHAAAHERRLDEMAGPAKAELLTQLRRITALLD